MSWARAFTVFSVCLGVFRHFLNALLSDSPSRMLAAQCLGFLKAQGAATRAWLHCKASTQPRPTCRRAPAGNPGPPGGHMRMDAYTCARIRDAYAYKCLDATHRYQSWQLRVLSSHRCLERRILHQRFPATISATRTWRSIGMYPCVCFYICMYMSANEKMCMSMPMRV